jgi:hypothetical protein
MDLKDATLMVLSASAGHPALASLAQSVYDQLAQGEAVPYGQLQELIEEASGKGVLRAVRATYGPVAFEAIFAPILQEIGEQAPIHSSRRSSADIDLETDPLRASVWSPH